MGATKLRADSVATYSSEGPADWSQSPTYADWALCDPLAPGVGLIRPDVCAPGDSIVTTLLGGGYWAAGGTTMSTAHVSGIAALILSKNPQLTSTEVHEILETTALDLGDPGKDNDYGAGRVRALEAVSATPEPDPGIHAPVAIEGAAPATLVLAPTRPNPFGGVTALDFYVPASGAVRLTVHDVAGRRVATLVDQRLERGWHPAEWNGGTEAGRQAAAGVYFLRLKAGAETRVRKVVRLD